MDSEYCTVCGISKTSAYISYDGYKSPRIQTRCVNARKKCDNPEDCIQCTLNGGHIIKLNGNGRHKWSKGAIK